MDSAHASGGHDTPSVVLLSSRPGEGTVSAKGWTVRPGSRSAHPPAATGPESALWPTRYLPLGSGVNGAPEARPRGARMRSTVDAGGADPDNARHSVPGPCDLRSAIGAPGARLTAETSSCRAARGRYGGDRLRPVPGQPCAAAAAPAGLPPGRARANCRPATASSPATLARRHPVIPAALLSLACSRNLALAVRPGAPKVRP